jgi:arsenate reductase
MPVQIYHNPRCSKSRATLELLRERGIEPEIIEYLKTPPDSKTLKNIAQALDKDIHALFRTGEDEFTQARDQIMDLTTDERLAWLAAHPRVLERPIVVTAAGARIGRPPEHVLTIID